MPVPGALCRRSGSGSSDTSSVSSSSAPPPRRRRRPLLFLCSLRSPTSGPAVSLCTNIHKESVLGRFNSLFFFFLGMVTREIGRSPRAKWTWSLLVVLWLAVLTLATSSSSSSDSIETSSTPREYLRGLAEESRRRLQETTTTITTYSLDLDKIDAPARHRKSIVTKRTVKKATAPARHSKSTIQPAPKENPVEEARHAEVTTENRGQRQRRRRQCRQLRRMHQVVPGRSWGTMTKQQQDQWLSLQCDDFFCEPHELAGKGIYKCQPLPADVIQQEDTEPAHNEYLAEPPLPPPVQQQ